VVAWQEEGEMGLKVAAADLEEAKAQVVHHRPRQGMMPARGFRIPLRPPFRAKVSLSR